MTIKIGLKSSVGKDIETLKILSIHVLQIKYKHTIFIYLQLNVAKNKDDNIHLTEAR